MYLDFLKSFVAYKSISTNPEFLPEITKTVNFLKAKFEAHGFVVTVFDGKEVNPVIFANLVQDPKLETVLIYGHYDVQPADKKDGWTSDPFTLTERDGRIFGRGAIDNKGQIAIHITTVFELMAEKKLKYNIKFLIEGNEETSNPEMSSLLKTHKDEFQSDYVLVSDGEVVGDNPTIDMSLRGGLNLTIKFRTAQNNLHSGIYGGAVPNAAYELTRFLSQLYTANNQIAIPNYYDHVDQITKDQLDNNLVLKSEADKLLKHTGVKTLLAEPDMDFFTQTGLRPTIQVTSLKSGYLDPGYSNIVPATAEAKLNFRIVKSQTSQEALEKFTMFAKACIPSYVDFEISSNGQHEAVKANISSPIFKLAQNLLEASFGKPVLFKNVGGAIPFVGDIQDIFGVDVLQVPLCNDDCNMHGVDENYDLQILAKAQDFSRKFFSI